MAHWIVRPRIDVTRESGLDVLPRQQTTVGAGEDDIGRIRPHGDVTALASADVIPVADRDAARSAAGAAKRGVVLLCAADAIRKMAGGRDVVELRRRLILFGPRFSAVERNVHAPVVGLD